MKLTIILASILLLLIIVQTQINPPPRGNNPPPRNNNPPRDNNPPPRGINRPPNNPPPRGNNPPPITNTATITNTAVSTNTAASTNIQTTSTTNQLTNTDSQPVNTASQTTTTATTSQPINIASQTTAADPLAIQSTRRNPRRTFPENFNLLLNINDNQLTQQNPVETPSNTPTDPNAAIIDGGTQGLVISASDMQNILKTIDDLFFIGNPRFVIQNRKLFRLSFHDCMAGCDGSIDNTAQHNRGFQDTVSVLDRAYNLATIQNSLYINKFLSRADFWALVQFRALGYSILTASKGQPIFNNATPIFQYGRRSNPMGPKDDDVEGEFPDGSDSWSKNFGFVLVGLKGKVSQPELVALMGLHGAGTTTASNGGYQGPWGIRRDLDRVNNNFFINLLGISDPPINFVEVPTLSVEFGEQFQFNTTRGANREITIMLHSDMGIYYDYSPQNLENFRYYPQGNNERLIRTNPNVQPLAPNRSQQAWNYAKNNVLYLGDLIESYKKMLAVPNEFGGNLLSFYPQAVCERGVWKCKGDILFTNCGINLNSFCINS